MDLQTLFAYVSIFLSLSFLIVGLYYSPILNSGCLHFLLSHWTSMKDSQLILIPLFAITIFWLIFFSIRKKSCNTKLPPGKFGWPIIGETLDWAMPGKAEKFIAERTDHYSQQVFKTSLLCEKMVVFCGPSGNKFVFSNENKLLKVWFPYSILKLLGLSDYKDPSEETRRRRSMFIEFLKPEAIQKYIHVMDFIAKQHLEEHWVGKETLKASTTLNKLTFAVSCHLFMGVQDPSKMATFADKFDAFAAGLFCFPLNLPGTTFNRALEAGNFMRSELRKIIRKQKIQLSEGKDHKALHLLSHLLLTPDDDGQFMSEEDITSLVLTILFASSDSTTLTLTSLVYYLADHPDVYDQVLREQIEIAKLIGPNRLLSWEDTKRMKYSKNVVNEVLRIAPPAPGTFREVIHDISFGGFVIPRRWKIFWTVESTHRDPKYFPNPEKFDPSRFEGSGPVPFSFTPFGGGPRMCPGNEFARHVVLTFMHNLAIRFKWRKLDPNEKIAFIPYVSYPNGLPITVEQHSDHMVADE